MLKKDNIEKIEELLSENMVDCYSLEAFKLGLDIFERHILIQPGLM